MRPTIWKNDKYEIKYEGMEEKEKNKWQHVVFVLDNTDKNICAIEKFDKNDDENDYREEVRLGVNHIIANVKELENYREEIERKLKQMLVRFV